MVDDAIVEGWNRLRSVSGLEDKVHSVGKQMWTERLRVCVRERERDGETESPTRMMPPIETNAPCKWPRKESAKHLKC